MQQVTAFFSGAGVLHRCLWNSLKKRSQNFPFSPLLNPLDHFICLCTDKILDDSRWGFKDRCTETYSFKGLPGSEMKKKSYVIKSL